MSEKWHRIFSRKRVCCRKGRVCMTQSIIRFEHVTKKYGEKVILNDFCMNVQKGEFITIIGSSGCGKTTVLKMVNGLKTPTDGQDVTTTTNHSGGIQGGISNGQDIYFRIAFKPVATILTEQHTVDLEGNPTLLKARGRHDPCVLPRAVPVVEAAVPTLSRLSLAFSTSARIFSSTLSSTTEKVIDESLLSISTLISL